jgi:hypothetical protein
MRLILVKTRCIKPIDHARRKDTTREGIVFWAFAINISMLQAATAPDR